MSSVRFQTTVLFIMAALAYVPAARGDMFTISHAASALPGAPGPAITLSSVTANNDGTNLIFTLSFANPTIEGPSSGNADAVFGFINLDADKNSATGVTGATLDTTGFEPGFGHFSPNAHGNDAYINLSSEGDPLHGSPGRVDLVKAVGSVPISTFAVSYTNRVGSSPSTEVISIPLALLGANGISLTSTGDFSVIVGNINNATDFLATGTAAAVPEPSQVTLILVIGLTTLLMLARRHMTLPAIGIVSAR
jgi:hypothetical protein